MFVIQRTDKKFVSKPGSKSSYATRLQNARVFTDRGSAEADRCPDNERVVSVEELLIGD